jgi:hypothetical protein
VEGGEAGVEGGLAIGGGGDDASGAGELEGEDVAVFGPILGEEDAEVEGGGGREVGGGEESGEVAGRGEVGGGSCADGEGEAECRTRAGGGDDGEFAAEHACEAAGDGEAKAGAAVASGGGGVGLDEGFEEGIDLFRGEADAGIDDIEDKVGPRDAEVVADEEFDVARGCEFDGVGEEVDEDLAEACGVGEDAVGDGAFEGAGEGDTFLEGTGADEGVDFDEEIWEAAFDGFEMEAAGFDFGEVEDVGDEGEEVLARASCGEGIAFTGGGVGGGEEEVGVAKDGGEGGAEFMGHVGEEGGLGLAGGFGLFTSVAKLSFGGAACAEVGEDEGEGTDGDDGAEGAGGGDGEEGGVGAALRLGVAGGDELVLGLDGLLDFCADGGGDVAAPVVLEESVVGLRSGGAEFGVEGGGEEVEAGLLGGIVDGECAEFGEGMFDVAAGLEVILVGEGGGVGGVVAEGAGGLSDGVFEAVEFGEDFVGMGDEMLVVEGAQGGVDRGGGDSGEEEERGEKAGENFAFGGQKRLPESPRW